MTETCTETTTWGGAIVRCDFEVHDEGDHMHDLGDGMAVGWGPKGGRNMAEFRNNLELFGEEFTIIRDGVEYVRGPIDIEVIEP